LPDTHSVHRRVDIRHCIVDRQAGRDRAAGRVDVQGDWFRRRVGFEEEELRYDRGGERVVDFAVQADDALLKEFGEDVGYGALAGALYNEASAPTCPPSAALLLLVKYIAIACLNGCCSLLSR
jgi:hypothetical protein